MVCRIEVSLKPEFADARAESILSRLKSDFSLKELADVRRVNVYSFEDDLAENEAELIAKEVLSDPVNQYYSIAKPASMAFDAAIEVGFRPGVKDNVGETTLGAAIDVLGRELKGQVFTSTLYLFSGKFPIDEKEIKRIAEGVLCNPLIEQWGVLYPNKVLEYYSSIRLPKAGAQEKGSVFEIPMPSDSHELEKLSKHRLLALTVEEMRIISEYYKRVDVRLNREKEGLSIHPTDVELECIAQTWSEHCKHKIFNAVIDYEDNSPDEAAEPASGAKKGKKAKPQKKQKTQKIDSLFKTYIYGTTNKIKGAEKYLLSVFTDNAGVIAINDDWALAVKVETHNTPSALDPYGGALTGILGVNRDVLGTGLGAKPIFNTDIFCFADPAYAGSIPPRLLHPKRVFEGVRAGVERGGNASGIPTVNGSIYFDDRYLGKPLVYCGTGGIMPRKLSGKRLSHEKNVQAGDRIFMVGGRVGKDGIHGATFSSEGLHEGSPTSAVQLGDPITQKRTLDFLLQSRDLGLHSGLTDNGAGGLSSSVGEMAQFSGGATVHLERCPLKYPGLDPWEIFVSESQERMTVAVPADKIGDFVTLAAKHDVEATDLGEFTNSGYLKVLYHNHTVAYLALGFLHGGLPKMRLKAVYNPPAREEPIFDMPANLGAELLSLLSRPNICSKESIIRQYDHEVQGMSVIKPLCGTNGTGPSDAAVLQPIPDKRVGIVVSHGLCPRAGDIDPYIMAQLALDEAVRNYVASGGQPTQWGALDNFCWPDPVASAKNPDGEQKLAALVRSNQGLSEACIAYGLPLISGKDSMKNDYQHGNLKISVPPTLLVSLCGVIKDSALAVSTDFKSDGDVIYILGKTYDELGASEYYAAMGEIGKNAPKVRLEENFALYNALHSAMSRSLVRSCHDCSDGGLAVALAECSIGGQIGCNVHLGQVLCEGSIRSDKVLFSESAGRFIVSVSPENCREFESMMHSHAFSRIGHVKAGDEFAINAADGAQSIKLKISELEGAFKKTITW